jgi:DnaJ-class molecular chaperone
MSGSTNVVVPDLETLCENCRGKGGWREGQHGSWYSCGRCNGAGYVPTEIGERVITIMRHNFKSMLHDAKDE